MVTITVNGMSHQPCTLFMGDAAPTPFAVPGFAGTLGIDPFTIAPFGPYDGLGFFGGSFPFFLDNTGAASFTIRVPVDLGAPGPLPVAFSLQAVVGQPANPTGEVMAFSNAVVLTVDEPSTSPSVSGIDVQVIQEGSSPTVLISGGGFLERATLTVPRVSFLSTTMPGSESDALSVSVVDTDPGPGVTAALQVVAPPGLGSIPSPPMTSAGLALIRIDFSATGLYNAANPAATFTTNPTPGNYGDPTYLVYQTNSNPSFTSMTPQAALTSGNCAVSVTGSGFLTGAEVRMDPGGMVTSLSPTAVTQTQVDFTVPPGVLSSSLYGVTVRNVDHFPTSPKESTLSPPGTDFAVFRTGVTSNVTVTGISPVSIVEGTGGGTIFISGTCPSVGTFTALESRAGITSVNLGSNLDGTDASVSLPVVAIQTPAAGQFVIEALVPDLPPGLNPAGVTAGGLGNAGVKHLQLIPPPCLEPGGNPHLTFGAIPGAEPGNELTYLAQAAPQVTGVTPNNAGRVDGGQSVTITGTGFFTNDTSLPSSNGALMGTAVLGGTIADTPFTNVTIIDDQTITATTPDLSLLGLALPFQTDITIRNPDGQPNPSGAGDDFWIVDSLSDTTPTGFPVVPGVNVLDTGLAVASANVYTFDTSLTVSVASIIQAHGESPVIIRCRGDVLIDGDIDLSGGVFATAPGPNPAPLSPPAAGGSGAMGGDVTLVQPPLSANLGASTFNALTLGPFSSFGNGGGHGPIQAGGGGGGGMAGAGAMGLGMDQGLLTGGLGGPTLGFLSLPPAILGAGDGTEYLYPPGGSGGGAGGMGASLPYSSSQPANQLGLSGSGGNGGGAILIAADGIITVNGVITASGEAGYSGAFDSATLTIPGAGGGGGSGGGILLQAIQGIVLGPTASTLANGGLGGVGALAGVNDGGGGSDGMIRFALPAQGSATPQIDPLAVVSPTADTTGW